jgi:hypothetical protein
MIHGYDWLMDGWIENKNIDGCIDSVLYVYIPEVKDHIALFVPYIAKIWYSQINNIVNEWVFNEMHRYMWYNDTYNTCIDWLILE